jgi:hypothetical protein
MREQPLREALLLCSRAWESGRRNVDGRLGARCTDALIHPDKLRGLGWRWSRVDANREQRTAIAVDRNAVVQSRESNQETASRAAEELSPEVVARAVGPPSSAFCHGATV